MMFFKGCQHLDLLKLAKYATKYKIAIGFFFFFFKRKSDLNKLSTIAFVIVKEKAKKRWSGRSSGPWWQIYGSGIGWVRNWMGRNQWKGKQVKRRNGDMVRWDWWLLHVAIVNSASQTLAGLSLLRKQRWRR